MSDLRTSVGRWFESSRPHETNVQAKAHFCCVRGVAIKAEFVRLPAKCQRVVRAWGFEGGFEAVPWAPID